MTNSWLLPYVGLLKIETLPETVNEKWIAEACPGKMAISDKLSGIRAEARALFPSESQQRR